MLERINSNNENGLILKHALLTALLLLAILIFFIGVFFYDLSGYFGPLSTVIKYILVGFGILLFISVFMIWILILVRGRYNAARKAAGVEDSEKGSGTIATRTDEIGDIQPSSLMTETGVSLSQPPPEASADSATNEGIPIDAVATTVAAVVAPVADELGADHSLTREQDVQSTWARDWSSENSSRIWTGIGRTYTTD